jgi:WD40 repeat protein
MLSGGGSWGKASNTLNLWDAATGALVRAFEGHSDRIFSVSFSPDGGRALSGSDDGTMRLWNAVTGALVRTFEGHSGPVWAVAFSPDGRQAISGSADGTMMLWDAAAGSLLRTFEVTSLVTSVAFSPDGRLLLSGDQKTIKLWDAATGDLVRTLDGSSSLGRSIAFSSDGSRVLSGSYDKTMKLWDAASGALVRTFEGHDGTVSSVAFSPDGSRVLSGSDDKTMMLWDAATGSLLRTFKGHSASVTSVVFSPDGRRIMSGSSDATIRIWDAEYGAELAALIGGRGSQWLALTPAGFFASSRAANELLAIVRGLEVTTIDQVHQSLFNPDLAREALAGDPGGELKQAAKVINLEKVLDSGPAPLVSIKAHAGGPGSVRDLATVAARIEDRGKGVGRIEWRLNGITTAVAAKPPGNGPAYTITRQLALDHGDNIIEVVAYNGSNLLASLPARTTIKFVGAANRIKPKLHILAIGINAYVDRGSPLRFSPLGLAVKDATAFGAAMKKAAGGLYKEVRVTLALDRDATRDNLEKTVAKIAREIHPRDSFILFAAGHGTSENGHFYFIPQDYQSGPGNLARGAIGQDRLQDWLANRIKAKRAFILLDTCESGALVAGHARSRVDAPASEAAVGRLHEATGRPVLTAAAAGQFAHEGLIGPSGERHGVFTWAVLDALLKGDSNGNGLIELTELVRHVQSVVPAIAAKLGGKGRAATSEPIFGQQAARFGSRGEDFAVAHRLQ